MYKITKVINNNIVCSLDDRGQEIILRGLGIGYQKKKGETVPDDKVEKVYSMKDPKRSDKLQQLLAQIPEEYLEISTEIIEHARRILGKRLSENIYITLTDHISFAISRKNENLEYHNVMLSEIKRFYTQEYEIGRYALDLINERLHVQLCGDEAGFIALHIVNAELETNMSDMYQITGLIRDIFEIIRVYYGRAFDSESLDYDRFVTHLKYFSQRLFSNSYAQTEDTVLQDMIRSRYTKDYNCALKIKTFIQVKYKKHVSEEEVVFLTIHLHRLFMNDSRSEQEEDESD
ncbi:MAG: PRD domain-containing protein [Lachnospiraceae bacterium]|nr:PRD domain-containing protein [Lachnospiraceae bacterium]MDY4971251.1 PRD domain-containing protein [Lachnospiraceae bacterium]